MLTEIEFEPVYATGENEPATFFLDALLNSTQLDMGLGYFSSSGFRALAFGFAYFIRRGGKMRMIINNVLSEEDKNAIYKGQSQNANEFLENHIINDFTRLKQTLTRKDKHFFRCLSWLIASKRLEMKATVPKLNKSGIVHQKFGIFKDLEKNSVAFTGSVNFSQTALFSNVEALWCDCSWMNNPFNERRINYFENLFQKTWTGFSDVVEVIPIEKVKTAIQEQFLISNEQELIDEEIILIREEVAVVKPPKSYLDKLEKLTNKLHPTTLRINDTKELPKLREYQSEAIRNWKDNKYRGILEMATGTGKTFTALSAIWELYKETKKLFVIVSCPFIHLAQQWQEEAKKFGLDGILVGESQALWIDDAARQAQLFSRKKIDLVVFFTTNASFSSEKFQKIIALCLTNTLLVVDEAHYAGAYRIRKLLPQICPYRLGLSATPERHGDEEGTTALFDYFDKVVFSFPIELAIGRFLTPYEYYPIPVELTESEFQAYCSLTDHIARLAHKEDSKSLDRLKKLSIERARLQNNSINKLFWLMDNIKELPLDYSLFYAGDRLFDDIKRLLGNQLKVRIHEFTAEQTPTERKKLLKDFAQQKIQSLIAMKCLDEGVDVPPTRVAYFLASSSNPREFVQRRGRILRQYPGKENAVIYDLISIPPKSFITEARRGKKYHAVKSAFVKEYKRVLEFSEMATNQFHSLNDFFAMADQLNLLDITKD